MRGVIAPTASCHTIPVTLNRGQLPNPDGNPVWRDSQGPAWTIHPRPAGPTRPSGRPRDPSYAPGGIGGASAACV